MDTSEVQSKIKQYESLIADAKVKLVRAETQLAAQEVLKTELEDAMKKHDATPETLPGMIQALEADIAAELIKLDAWAAEIKEVLG